MLTLKMSLHNDIYCMENVCHLNNFCSFILQLAREVLDVAAMMVKPGVTTEEIDHAVHLVRILLQCGSAFCYHILKLRYCV